MSSKRLAVVTAAGHAAQASRGDSSGQQPLRGEQRPPALNLLIICGVLGALVLTACLACRRCRGRGRGRARAGKSPPPPSSTVYTLADERRPYLAQCYESPVPPYRRPPTPGPPPAYDSVVSISDQFRRFGNDEDYSDDIDKLQKYLVDDVRSSREVAEESMSGLNKLRHCKVQGSCTCYEENREMGDEIYNTTAIKSDMDLGNDRNVVVYCHEENVEREIYSESSGNRPQVAGIHVLIDIDSTSQNISPSSEHPENSENVGQTDISPAEIVELCSAVGRSKEEPRRIQTSSPRITTSPRRDESCQEHATGSVEDTTRERGNTDDSLPSYEVAVTFRNKCQNTNREEGR